MKCPSDFLIALGQALSGMTLYAPDHVMRTTALSSLHEMLREVLPERGVVRFTFLHGDTIVGSEILVALRGWDWSRKLAAAGLQRIEIDVLPTPTDADLQQFLRTLHHRLQTRAPNGVEASIAVRGFRAGSLAVTDETHDQSEGPELPTEASEIIAPPALDEEALAVRWIHDEAASGRPMPLAEVEGVVHGLAAALQRDRHVLMPLLKLKSFDQYSTTHSCNVSMLSMGLAEQLGFAASDVRAVGTAALLHDIGKVRVPVEILVKPGRLTDAEMELMRSHATEGARMLSERGRGHALAAVVAYEHHVWSDGAGGYPTFRYPRRCHYASRLVHVCDLYDALSTNRPYRQAWPRERTLQLLKERSGIEVDAEIVEAFVAMSERTRETRTLVANGRQNDWTDRVAEAAKEFDRNGS